MTAIEELDDLLTIHRCNTTYNEYMLGLYNGLEPARSIVTREEPVYMSKEGNLDPVGIRKYAERFI